MFIIFKLFLIHIQYTSRIIRLTVHTYYFVYGIHGFKDIVYYHRYGFKVVLLFCTIKIRITLLIQYSKAGYFSRNLDTNYLFNI